MDLSSLGGRLLEAGAPVLKSIIQKQVGGVGGILAGAAVDTLADALRTDPTPEAIVQAIERDPVAAAPVVREVEQQFTDELARLAEANRDVMLGYQQVLLADAKQEGWLAKRWRPIFALAFTVCFVGIVLTICRAIWIGQMVGIEAVSGLLITMVFAGCAVLGVQVWQRSEEKKAGVV